ncbi:PiggyBac transposable element-derived protein 4 [Eumeta japonica]|uniref:PiggyBac transposable element-derived protein 4 n=1 Tax=Eumeta variegata TaxID=151549 RepID=A0A4C1W1R3_EUMVA|nr:PiggyBac transposable element-derived protein 4 [Eumeta japonica]
MKHFFSLILYMGLVKLPKLADYWSTDEIIGQNFPRSVMSRNRFELLLQMIHFSQEDDSNKSDRLHRVQHLLDMLNVNFKNNFIPGQDICVDESMVPFRGRLLFCQYNKQKRHKYGIKLFKLCTLPGYIYKINIYAGKQNEEVNVTPQRVIMNLCQDLLNKGYSLYTDNWYTSVPLARELLENETHLIGTLRKNRKHFPKAVVSTKLKKNQFIAKESEDGITVLRWKDKRDVASSGRTTRKHDLQKKAVVVVAKADAPSINCSGIGASVHMRRACKIRNCVQLRTERQGTSGGGTVVYYKRSMRCCPIDTSQLINLEAIACKLPMSVTHYLRQYASEVHGKRLLPIYRAVKRSSVCREQSQRVHASLEEERCLRVNHVSVKWLEEESEHEFNDVDVEGDDPNFQPETELSEADDVSDEEEDQETSEEVQYESASENVHQETSNESSSEYYKDLRIIFATDGTGHEIFRCVMSKWRFSCLINCLRFDDSTTREERLKEDALAPISDMFNKFISNSQSQYTPGPYLCVDEMLLPFRGRCKFIYMPQKPAKYGIKILLLVDACTYYIYNAYIYHGKNSDGIGLIE